MNLLTLPLLPGAILEQQAPLVQSFEIINLLDLISLSVAIWTIWTAFSLPLGGALQRAFRLIAFGSLAFAFSHILDALVQELGFLSTETATLCHQGGVLISIMLFVFGISRLADTIPTLTSDQNQTSSGLLWSLAVGLILVVAAFSFIVYGLSLESAAISFIGISGCLIFMVVICFVLLLRARIGGAIGRALWLAFLGLLLFSLAHPLQSWALFQNPSTPTTNAIIHRLVVVPAFLIFALSLASLARTLSRTSMQEQLAAYQDKANLTVQMATPPSDKAARDDFGPRARAQNQPQPQPPPDRRNPDGGFRPFEPGDRWPI